MERLHLDEKGSPYYIQNRIKDSNIDSLNMLYRAIDLIKEGCTRVQIIEMLTNEGFKKKNIEKYLSVAYSVISTEYFRSEVAVFNLHFERYNRDIIALFNKEFHGDKWIQHKCGAYFQILEIMEAKEKLLGFHKANFQVILNQRNKPITREEKPKYNISKLSWDEKLELIRLFELTRREEDFPDVIEVTEEREESGFIVSQETEEPNILKIKHKDQPLPEYTETYTGLNDTFEKMKKTFEELAKKTYKDAGSKSV